MSESNTRQAKLTSRGPGSAKLAIKPLPVAHSAPECHQTDKLGGTERKEKRGRAGQSGEERGRAGRRAGEERGKSGEERGRAGKSGEKWRIPMKNPIFCRKDKIHVPSPLSAPKQAFFGKFHVRQLSFHPGAH